MAPLVSIVLPTRNGIATLPSLLDSIARQRVDFPFEIVAVDSSSTDGSRELLHKRADTLVCIGPNAFDHGLTRNLGIEHSTGPLVVLMVQDAVPASSSWLDDLTRPLRTDETIAGTFARQLPRPDASGITRYYLSRWLASSETPRTVAVSSRDDFERLPGVDRFDRCIFDNVCSCIRRTIWQELPFRSTPIAEDVEWAKEVLLAGYRLQYVPSAAVVHSHDRPARYEFDRTYILHRRLYELFGVRTIPTVPHLARAIVSSIALHMKEEPRGASRKRRALALAFAWPIGQYLGGLSAARGWKRFTTARV